MTPAPRARRLGPAAPTTAPAPPPRSESPFERSNLRTQVKEVILRRIVSGEYPPGARLIETRIAQELGVSQAPVREALRDLEQLGCIVHEPYRGCSVRAFSATEHMEAFPVRAALEALACRLAADVIGDDELAALEHELETMRDAARRGDGADQSLANARFHATIVRAARNPTLERVWTMLEPYSRTYIFVSRPAVDLVALSERHAPVLDALRERDGERAAAAMTEHLMQAADVIRPLADPADEVPVAAGDDS